MKWRSSLARKQWKSCPNIYCRSLLETANEASCATTILMLYLWYQFQLHKLNISICAGGSTCWSCGQSRWERDLCGYFLARLICHSILFLSKLAVRRKSAEISRSGEREDAILPFSVAVLTYARLAFIKLRFIVQKTAGSYTYFMIV